MTSCSHCQEVNEPCISDPENLVGMEVNIVNLAQPQERTSTSGAESPSLTRWSSITYQTNIHPPVESNLFNSALLRNSEDQNLHGSIRSIGPPQSPCATLSGRKKHPFDSIPEDFQHDPAPVAPDYFCTAPHLSSTVPSLTSHDGGAWERDGTLGRADEGLCGAVVSKF